MADTPLNLHALMLASIQAIDFTQPGWTKAMEQAIARGHTAASIAGIADRAGVKADTGLFKGLSKAERAEIKAIVKAQLDYLKGFVKAAPDMSPQAVKARAALYAGAVRQTYYQQRWGDWDIPDDLLPGNQQCLTNCRCTISVSDNGDGTGELTREMHGSENHCTECPPLVGTYDVKRRKL